MEYLLTGEESDRLYYRKVRPSDFELWLPFHQDPSSTEYWPQSRLKPIEECQKWFDTVYYRYANNLGGFNALIDKNTGELIGQCGLLIQTVDNIQEVEIGYSLLPAFRNKGYATEAARKCKLFAFEKNLAPSLISIIHTENKPSRNVAIKNGMNLDKTTIYNDIPVHIFRVSSH